MSRDRVVCERVYPRSPERVWEAIADRHALSRWLMPNDFAPLLGHRFIFTAPPQQGWNGIIECEVIALDPPRHLAFTWKGDPRLPLTVVTVTLESVLSGTRLRLEHAVVGDAASPGLSLGYDLDADWETRLRHLFRVQVDEIAMTDELFRYLTDSTSQREDHTLVRWLRSLAPEVVPVLESMILDGVTDRPDVAHYVHALAEGDLGRQLRAARLQRNAHADEELPSVLDLPRLFRLEIDEASFITDAYAFVTTPDASRYAHPVVDELDALAPDVLPGLETMLLEGVEDPDIVADYLHGALGSPLE